MRPARDRIFFRGQRRLLPTFQTRDGAGPDIFFPTQIACRWRAR